MSTVAGIIPEPKESSARQEPKTKWEEYTSEVDIFWTVQSIFIYLKFICRQTILSQYFIFYNFALSNVDFGRERIKPKI